MNEYIPGECNIGPAEIARRRTVGVASLVVTILLLLVLLWMGVDRWWRLIVFFPAAMSASGFLQAHFRFCSGFARRGLYNFGPLGQTSSVDDEASRKKDQREGMKIIYSSILVGVAATIIGVLLC